MAKDRPKDAAGLLGDWRAAERDTAAAKVAETVADMALAAARAAEEAAGGDRGGRQGSTRGLQERPACR